MEGWLNHVGVPLFVSHRRLARRKTLPKARTGWALDSGGFSELSLYGGWHTTPEEYVDAVKRYDREIGNLEWASCQDMMCEEPMLAKTGLTVTDHQRLTVANFIRLEQLWHDIDDQWHPESPFMPALQGGENPESYLRCWDMYGEAGVDLANYPLVGVGSVCRRQHTGEIRDILEAIRDRDPQVPLHGYGIKTLGLKLYGDLLCSADSMGWSMNARKNPRSRGAPTRAARTASSGHCGGAATSLPAVVPNTANPATVRSEPATCVTCGKCASGPRPPNQWPAEQPSRGDDDHHSTEVHPAGLYQGVERARPALRSVSGRMR